MKGSASRNYYNIESWGDDYFAIDQKGCVTVKKNKTANCVKIQDIIDNCHKSGITTPILLKFKDIIQDRAKRIINAFNIAIKDLNYSGHYHLIYPIKVNQFKSAIDNALCLDQQIGIEVGSKAELIIAILVNKEKKYPIICNGYKDTSYMIAALNAQKYGMDITITIEKLQELICVIEASVQENIKPKLGVRVKINFKGSSKWAQSAGMHSKFGLNCAQLLQFLELLEQHNMLSCLHLLHCHQGSQINSLSDIENYINEITSFYIELYKHGAKISILDVGGGLAINYGEFPDKDKHYTLEEYARTIVETVHKKVITAGIPTPNIYSESGRALLATHAVFITDIIDTDIAGHDEIFCVENNENEFIKKLKHLTEIVDIDNYEQIFFDANIMLDGLYKEFTGHNLSIETVSLAEHLLKILQNTVQQELINNKNLHSFSQKFLDILGKTVSKVLIANFSVFQSIPDSWAINQLFPVCPISNLNEPIEQYAVIHDITCDSDGKIQNYIGSKGIKPYLPLPEYNSEKPYLLGIFLTGAYQEIMGNLHNLFSRVNTVEIDLQEDGTFTISSIENTPSLKDIIQNVGYKNVSILNKIFHTSLTGSNYMDVSSIQVTI